MTHDIYNPWHGCTKVSEGCANCYMYFLDRQWDRDGSVTTKAKTGFKYPLQKYRDGRYKIEPGEHIRVCMTSDFFLEEADPWRPEVWDMLRFRSDVVWMLLTKRPQRITRCLPPDWGGGWENVQLGVTAENQARADERIPLLLDVPAMHRHVCVAPFIGPVDISKYLATGRIEYVQAGGENYDGARVCRYDWVRSLRDQCVATDVDFVFYETGTRFEKDGVTYFMPKKRLQSQQAFYSGLTYLSPTRPAYRIYLPGTRTPVPRDVIHERRFLKPHCTTCAASINCNGCSLCGNCCC